MKIGIAGANLPPYSEGNRAIELARLAEDVGIESLWTYEHIVVPSSYRSMYPYSPNGRMPEEGAELVEPLDWIAFLAGATHRIRFGTGMLVLPQHNPVMVAKRAATIDRLSGGRLSLGVGAGWLREEFDALGAPWAHRGQRMEEYIKLIRKLWTEEETTFDGHFVRLDRVRCLPKPLQTPGVPIIIGGHTDTAAIRAGRIGDGFYPSASPDRLDQLVKLVKQSAEDAMRDPETIEITAGIGSEWSPDLIHRYEEIGVSRININLSSRTSSELHRSLELLHDTIIRK